MMTADPSQPILEQLATFVANADIILEPKAHSSVCNALIDTLGCIIAGASSRVATKAQAATRGRTGTAPVFGTAHRRAPEAAAFLNGVAGHVLDFDDWESPGNTHPSAVIFPALLAACEGRVVSGDDIAVAYAAGFEVIARLGEAMNYDHYEKGWHATATLGAIGATAAAARLWGLDTVQCQNAMAIVVSRAAGLTAQFGSDTKPLQAGFAAESGLIAATLAAHGLTGQATALEGDNGYIALTAHSQSDRLVKPFENLGAPLALQAYGLTVKAYPSCGYTHRIIDCALALHTRGTVGVENITHIEIYLPKFHANIMPFKHPQDDAAARFSLPFCAAVALVFGAVAAADFTPNRWNDPKIKHLIDASDIFPFALNNPHLNYDESQPDRVVVTLTDGSVHEAAVAYPLGAPENPMTSDQIFEKFRRNVVGLNLPPQTIDNWVHWLETDDILTLLRSYH